MAMGGEDESMIRMTLTARRWTRESGSASGVVLKAWKINIELESVTVGT